ncbi:MAG: NIPSNAP family protein [Pseudomonadota bacterium]
MLLDVRTYRCRPGTLAAHLKLYEEHGREPQFRCLGKPLCYLKTETGNVNEYVHIWVYDSAADREAKRKVLWSDPDWLAYTRKSAELGALENQTNKLMAPVDFCPLGQAG